MTPAARDQVAAIRDHFERQLNEAALEMLPFPHLIVDGALPDDIYEQVLEANPFRWGSGEVWGDPAWTRRLRFDHAYDKRFQFNLLPQRREVDEPLWNAIGDAFGDAGWFGPLLWRRFPEYFLLRYGDVGEVGDFWSGFLPEVFLQRHDEGFRLDAHTDLPTRVATCIFSFASTGGYEHCGTQLLAPVDPTWRCWGNNHYSVADFHTVKVAPYEPNSCLVFFKTRHSWHSVSPQAWQAPDGRFGMQVQLVEPYESVLPDLSEPELLFNHQMRAETRLEQFRRQVRAVPGRLRSRTRRVAVSRRDREML